MVLVVVMLVFGVVAVIVLMIVRMGLERTSFAKRHMLQAVRFREGNHARLVAKCIDGPVEERFQARAYPEDYVGILQCASIRWAQREGVGGPSALDNKRRGTDTLHDAGDQRMDGLDRYDDRRRIGICVRSQKRQRAGQQKNTANLHFSCP